MLPSAPVGKLRSCRWRIQTREILAISLDGFARELAGASPDKFLIGCIVATTVIAISLAKQLLKYLNNRVLKGFSKLIPMVVLIYLT